MLGDKIMMAPVLSEGADTISVYFPIRDGGAPGDEEWVHWATGERCVKNKRFCMVWRFAGHHGIKHAFFVLQLCVGFLLRNNPVANW